MTANVRLGLVLALTTTAVWCVTTSHNVDDSDGVSWTDGDTSLVFAPGSNASCPWIVSLKGENLPTEHRLEMCTRAVPVAFEGVIMDSSGRERYFTKPLTSGSSDTSTSSTPKENLTNYERDSNGYVRLGGYGGYKVHEEKMTWQEAKVTCEEEGAHLVIVNSEEEAAAIQDYLESKRIWRRERPFTLHAGFYMAFATPSGRLLSSLGYERWAPKEPSAPVCGRIDHDAWLLFGACSQEERFMCEYEKETDAPAGRSAPAPAPAPAPAAPLPASPSLVRWTSSLARSLALSQALPHYWQGPPGSGVYFKRKDLVGVFTGNPWQDAKRVCELDGGRLAVVESEAEADVLVRYFQSLPDGEPREDTLLALRTTEPMDVLGNPLSASKYLRWVKKIFPDSCLCIDIKVLFHTCWCENVNVNFLCQIYL